MLDSICSYPGEGDVEACGPWVGHTYPVIFIELPSGPQQSSLPPGPTSVRLTNEKNQGSHSHD